MKWVTALIFVLCSSGAVAGYGSGGVPSVPCYVDGKYKGTIPINECKRIGGEIPGEKKSKP